MGNFIGYIICKKVESDQEETKTVKVTTNPSQFQEKAFAFEEVIQSRGKLVPDVDWYIMQ